MSNKKVTVVGNTHKFNIDLSKLPDEILSDLESISCTDIQQSNLVSKINKDKRPMPSPTRDAREKSINFGKGLDYVYGTKPVNNQEDYSEELNPFASGLQKIKPSARENDKLSWFKSAVVRVKSPNELHKVIDEALAAGMRINACHEGEWSFAEYVILGTHFHKVKKGELKKIMRELMLKGAEFHDRLLQIQPLWIEIQRLRKSIEC
ncbi:hypothetical protein [Wolbachia endosymbiont (group A) of Ennomos erosarius]|uniref:hypothetical protein n=1 Tax=Wolbachia endosymbiont (group A) of Ennomos erosarius TaxID=3066174 RepID=UPI00333F82BF